MTGRPNGSPFSLHCLQSLPRPIHLGTCFDTGRLGKGSTSQYRSRAPRKRTTLLVPNSLIQTLSPATVPSNMGLRDSPQHQPAGQVQSMPMPMLASSIPYCSFSSRGTKYPLALLASYQHSSDLIIERHRGPLSSRPMRQSSPITLTLVIVPSYFVHLAICQLW